MYIGAFGYDGQKSIWKEEFRQLDRNYYDVEFLSLTGEEPEVGDPFLKILQEYNISISKSVLTLNATVLAEYNNSLEKAIIGYTVRHLGF